MPIKSLGFKRLRVAGVPHPSPIGEDLPPHFEVLNFRKKFE
jgi:hypothetical protein